ncbi:Invasion protein B family [Pseudomonas gingeri]|uniref:Invasion protein B family n=1 Tax=Pseudomonas gingeri TaxID=117681 RepID=A0A7Y8CHV6_9PSED|nr:Invasion protein B family [Pseudomonas gingeri]NVZ99852.1 Invasion protein B family [Pseudomonas gingeri]NWA16692.1 Invasion protein B family [Pseudomonas gingeri]NWA53922.1 Invasion protein B family [Pseudomonas gingeri]NWA94154.1 Invasion protein B family [Pseudomonas gingeri]NWB01946.1 Invasion protein B family [Pseudomonas gingeri]
MRDMDIAERLRGALLYSGCTQAQLGQFDSHSTIEMEMIEQPNISLNVIDDDVWLWSVVAQMTPATFGYHAGNLMQFLLKGNAHARTGQLQLFESDGQLEVRLMLGEQALTSDRAFAEALDGFMEAIEELGGIIRQ